MTEDLVKDEIKSRISISELAGGFSTYGRLECPYRDCPGAGSGKLETQTNNDNYWHCHICKRGGDAIDWVVATTGVDFTAAKKVLAEKLGITTTPNKERVEILRKVVQAASEYLLDVHPEKLKYLEGRGISAKTVFKHQIGYIDTEGKVFEKAEVTEEDLKRVGLIRFSRSRGHDVSTLAGRYIFPIRDLYGRLIQLKGRADPEVLTDPKEKKCIALQKQPDAAPLNWGSYSHMGLLFLEEELEAAKKHKYVIVAEGEPDTLTLRELGFQAVGLQTSQGLAKHAHKFRGFSRVYLMLDNDLASQRGIIKELYELQIKLPDVQIYNAKIPNKILGTTEEAPIKIDVNDYVVKYGKTRADLELILRQATTSHEAAIEAWGPHYKDRDTMSRLSKLICTTTGDVKKQLIQKLSETTGRKVELLAFAIDPGDND